MPTPPARLHRATLPEWELTAELNGERFRMYDGDDELYYEGRWVADPNIDDEAFEGFEPLDCFGAPNAGCTRLDYRNDTTGEWATL